MSSAKVEDMSENVDMLCMACVDDKCNFKPMKAQRRACGDGDVQFDVKFCGICFTDVGVASNRKPTGVAAVYPIVPGHELAGIVTKIGKNVKKFKVGDRIGVGCWVDSCLSCAECKADREQWCKKGATLTYNAPDKHGRAGFGGCTIDGKEELATLGGYSTVMVVHEHFGIKIPLTFPLEAAGPVMCSGVTVYEPMKQYGLTAGMHLGVIGLGGLGLTAIKIGRALGASVSAVSRGIKKKPTATAAGATGFIASSDPESMSQAAQTFDLIIDTIPLNHDPKPYKALLKPRGHYVFLGMTEQFFGTFIAERACCCGSSNYHVSNTGSIAATQEIIDLCDRQGVVPDTQTIGVEKVNWAFEKLAAGNDDATRYVIDMGTLDEQTMQTYTAQAPILNDDEKPPSMFKALCFACKISCFQCCCCCCCC